MAFKERPHGLSVLRVKERGYTDLLFLSNLWVNQGAGPHYSQFALAV